FSMLMSYHSFPTRRSSDLIHMTLLMIRRLPHYLVHRYRCHYRLLCVLLAHSYYFGQLNTLGKPEFHWSWCYRKGNKYYGVFYLRSEEHTSELQSRENLVCR